MEKTFKRTLIYYGILSIIPLLILLYGVLFLNNGDEIGFTILNLYFLMPLVAFISGIIFTKNGIKPIWIHTIVFVLYMILVPLAIFHKVDFLFSLFIIIPSIFGILIGIIIRKVTKKKASQ